MKKYVVVLVVLICSITLINAQTPNNLLETNRAFTGAVAKKKIYHAIYQLDTNDPKIIDKAIHNINNALMDSRLEGKVKIELVTLSGGTEAVMLGSKFEKDIKDLIEKGVIVAQCNNSLLKRNLTRDQIFNFIAVVPSGNGEIIIRQAEGWAIIKP